MATYPPHFKIKVSIQDGKPVHTVYHNIDGILGFTTAVTIPDEMERLLQLAIEEGKRLKIAELKEALDIK